MDPDVIASVLVRGRWEGQCHRGDVTMEMGRGREGGRTEMGGEEREREAQRFYASILLALKAEKGATSQGGLQKLEKARRAILPQSQKELALPTP